jgi:hypothetical protein
MGVSSFIFRGKSSGIPLTFKGLKTIVRNQHFIKTIISCEQKRN